MLLAPRCWACWAGGLGVGTSAWQLEGCKLIPRCHLKVSQPAGSSRNCSLIKLHVISSERLLEAPQWS